MTTDIDRTRIANRPLETRKFLGSRSGTRTAPPGEQKPDAEPEATAGTPHGFSTGDGGTATA
jgi:hypothetical protein